MQRSSSWLLLAPVCLFLLFCFVTPIAYVVYLSFTDPSIGVAHYKRIFTASLYAFVMYNTFKISALATLLCLLIGYPLAYVMVRRPGPLATVLMACVVMSFWIGLIARTYAWLVILGNRGVVASFYAFLGLGKPPQILFTSMGTLVGMTHILLPFMVLALFGVMTSINPFLSRAAASLGARPSVSVWDGCLPLCM
ncbi:MAG: ABC transporter permease, partial [Pseudorhodoplanes sp.]